MEFRRNRKEEGGENPQQKRERLTAELAAAQGEVNHFLELVKTDFAKVDGSLGDFESIADQIEELMRLEDVLRDELKDMVEEYDTVTDSEAKIKLEKKVSDQHEKINTAREQRSSLEKELTSLMDKHKGAQGDFQATKSILEMKIHKADELRRELDELSE